MSEWARPGKCPSPIMGLDGGAGLVCLPEYAGAATSAPAGPASSIPPPRRFVRRDAESERGFGPLGAGCKPAAGADRDEGRSRRHRAPKPWPERRDILARRLAAADPGRTPAPAAPSTGSALDASLIPGRSIEPIDLANALKLAGARDAGHRPRPAAGQRGDRRPRLACAHLAAQPVPRADLVSGRRAGADGHRAGAERRPQLAVHRRLAATTAPGYRRGLARDRVHAAQRIDRGVPFLGRDLHAHGRAAGRERGPAGVQTANNDAMLQVAEAYFDLQQASGPLAIAREAAANAKELSEITGSYARTGQGLEADHRRALTELKHRRKDIQLFQRPVAGRLGQPGASLGAQPPDRGRAGRARRDASSG